MKKIGWSLLACLLISVLIIGCGGSSSTPSTPSATSPSSSASPVSSDFSLVGFAAVDDGTTGGTGYPSITVTTGTELQAAINAAKASSDTTVPRIIYVNGTITLSNSSDVEILLKGKSKSVPLANLSIIGVGTNGELNGIGIRMRYVQNIIIQNLKIHHVLYNTGEGDAIGICGPANHIWVDHCELYNSVGDLDGDGVDGRVVNDEGDKDYYDGIFDVKYNAAYITFSWNYVHDAYKTSLVGYSETGDITNDRKITYHHNYFYNFGSRTPLYRGGTGHVYNNYFNAGFGSAVNCRAGSVLRVEGNYFENSKNCIGWYYADSNTGCWDLGVGNIYVNCSGDQPTTSTGSLTISYNYTLTPTEDVKALVTKYAGVGIVNN
jgi:pectate lyase